MQRSNMKTRLRSFWTVDPDPEESLRYADEVVRRNLTAMERRFDSGEEPDDDSETLGRLSEAS